MWKLTQSIYSMVKLKVLKQVSLLLPIIFIRNCSSGIHPSSYASYYIGSCLDFWSKLFGIMIFFTAHQVHVDTELSGDEAFQSIPAISSVTLGAAKVWLVLPFIIKFSILGIFLTRSVRIFLNIHPCIVSPCTINLFLEVVCDFSLEVFHFLPIY